MQLTDKAWQLPNHLGRHIIFALVGMIFCGIGAACFLFSHLGVDPGSVFINGLSLKLGTSYGTSAALVNVVILAVVLLVDKRYINLSSLLAILAIGYAADGALWILHHVVALNPVLWQRILFLPIGILSLSFGITLYIRANLGIAALDIVAEILSDKLHRPYHFIRNLTDAAFFLGGLILGGNWGIGTLLTVICVGPLVSFFRPRIDAFARRFLCEGSAS